jgi:pimeloyl-ACP methyl ester carboxylesterase
MSEVLRRRELELVEGAGHVPWLGDPEPVARRVDAYLA